jgi:hypothetical protein
MPDISPIPMSVSDFDYVQDLGPTSFTSSPPASEPLFFPTIGTESNNTCMLSSSPQNEPLSFTSSSSPYSKPNIKTSVSAIDLSAPSDFSNLSSKASKSSPYTISLSSSPSNESLPLPSKPIKQSSINRTLSYESVMTLSDLNVNPAPSVSPVSQPLDHDKVMEALRAKLRRSTSPYAGPSRKKSSPEPQAPPNTYPTTGVLLLNLKSRRRKSSVTKRIKN